MTEIHFEDHPEFTPNVTPLDMFQMGVFGGTYWRPIKSSVLGKNLKDQHLEFPDIAALPANRLTSTNCNPSINYYSVRAGSSLEDWESKGWIKEQDPYGWVQWYCRFYYGRRSGDDDRQIDRWVRYAGSKGRWRKNLERQIREKGSDGASKVVRQGLLQWAYIAN